MRVSILTLAILAAGCSQPASDDPFGSETDATPNDTDVVAVEPCSGTQSFLLGGAPEAYTEIPTAWQVDEAEVETQPFRTGYKVSKSDDCVLLAPGTLVFNAIPSGCAITEVSVDLDINCGPACVEMLIAADMEQVASTTNGSASGPYTLRLQAEAPFSTLVIGSLDTKVCGITITRAPIPPGLQPTDTGAPF